MIALRRLLLLAAVGLLAACGGKSVWAPDEAVEQRRVITGEPPYLMLKTMMNNRGGTGGHTALLINGSQLVMWDPAGRWFNSLAPERNDVVYGMIPGLIAQYDSFHARDTHHVVSQKIYVSPQVAERAMQLAMNHGPAMDAQCAASTSAILQQLPGFGHIKRTMFPANLMRQFEEMPGVTTTRYYENDSGKN